MTYRAPVEDILLALETAADLPGLIEDGLFDELDMELVRAIIEEAGRFATEELAPLNQMGDQVGARLEGDRVILDERLLAAYRRWCDAGWAALPVASEIGGQGLPNTVSMAVAEIWNAANLAFALGPILTHGAIEAIAAKAPPDIKSIYLPRLASGEWSGTMNLTEPQAGSDLAALRTRAERREDGTYRIFGTKIYISYGEHELTGNIVHMVLARLEDAPPGTAGISLFLVPKYLVNEDGSLGARNDVKCSGLEHKLGIHSSPTCVMSYGDEDGAVGYLIGEENKGLAVMFIMMNAARLAVGIQGVGIGERATQQAMAYANERRQGRTPDTPAGEQVEIVAHPDVRRNLLTMRAMTAASRAICYATAREIDISRLSSDQEASERASARAALLTPVAKAFSTDAGIEAASIGIQVHGGMGYIEETGAAQHFRDGRVTAIYEGTNGIQAIDLVTRKLDLGRGEFVKGYIDELRGVAEDVRACNLSGYESMATILGESIDALEDATGWMLSNIERNPGTALAGAGTYLKLFGTTAGGIYLAKAALKWVREHGEGRPGLAEFYAHNISVNARGYARSVKEGGGAVAEADERLFTV